MKKLNAVVVFVLLSHLIFGQTDTSFKKDYSPKLVLDFKVLDVPFMFDALQARANYRAGNIASNPAAINVSDFISIIESPSMSQATAYSTSFYNAVNYGIAKGWNSVFNPNESKRRRLWGNVVKEFTAAVVFVGTTKVPFAGGWAHEELHRASWIPRGVGSYNHIWSFDLAPDALTYVGEVRDQDLIDFKREDPAGIVRMNSAGIEAHYLNSQTAQVQDFLYNTHLPLIAFHWANVLAAADYVNRAHTTATIEEHAAVYDDEPDMLKRDFTGNDFTAWVYDLHTPNEAYDERGLHPTGIGIDRYRNYNDLSKEMLAYVEKMGQRQWLNLLSPYLFRVRNIKVSQHLNMNFAVRHYLTSFGDDTQLDLFLDVKGNKNLVSLHKYTNHNTTFAGLEWQTFLKQFRIGKRSFLTSSRVMAWTQPDAQQFYTAKQQAGGLVAIKAQYETKSKWMPYFELEGKTKGWVAGNPFLNEKVSLRLGVMAVLGR